jgi:hypothetical protein
LYRDHFFLLPLCMFGLGELLRVPQVRRSRLIAIVVGALVAVVALSVPAFKVPRYVLAVAPFLYAFAGVCLAAFARSPDKLRPATGSVVRFSMSISVAAFFAVALVYMLGGPVTGWYLIAHAFGTLLCIALGELWLRSQLVTQQLAGLSLVGLLVFAIANPRLDVAPPYAAIADALRPQLSDVRSAYPSFVARDCDILQGYLDRAGTRLEDLAESPERAAQDANLKAFVIGPADADRPAMQRLLTALTAHAREITSAIVAKTGVDSGYRVFVR